MLLGIKVISKFIAFDRFAAANVSKNHPAAANVSYSRVASSSLGGNSDEHQIDKKSPWGSEKIAVITLVCRAY
jgi:hypothetical protein